MQPTFEYFKRAEAVIRTVLDELRPLLLKAYGNAEYSFKADRSVVTELDLLVENHLREALKSYDSNVGFGGEEGGVDYEQRTFWICDPIDGTEHLTRGIRGCTNQLALIHDGQAVASIIYNFVDDEWFWAFKGQGAFCNDQPLKVSVRSLDRAWVNCDTARTKASPAALQSVERLQALPLKIVHTVEAARFVAAGKIEGYVSIDGKGGPWDYAPRIILMQEAGVRVTHLNGGAYNFRDSNFIACAPQLYDDIFNAINPKGV